jgi:hypothetical protein
MATYPMPASNLRVGVVSTRLASTDGVSLEAEKWSVVLRRLGHQCFYFAGLSDRDPALSYVVPGHISCTRPSKRPTRHSRPHVCGHLLERFMTLPISQGSTIRVHKRFDLHMLLIENALAIPLNIRWYGTHGVY